MKLDFSWLPLRTYSIRKFCVLGTYFWILTIFASSLLTTFCSPHVSVLYKVQNLFFFLFSCQSWLGLLWQVVIDCVTQTTNIYFSLFWRLESSRSRCLQIQRLLRVCDCYLVASHMAERRGQKQGIVLLLIRALITLMRVPPLWPDYLPKAHRKISLHWGLSCNIWILEGHKLLIPTPSIFPCTFSHSPSLN